MSKNCLYPLTIIKNNNYGSPNVQVEYFNDEKQVRDRIQILLINEVSTIVMTKRCILDSKINTQDEYIKFMNGLGNTETTMKLYKFLYKYYDLQNSLKFIKGYPIEENEDSVEQINKNSS